MKVGIIGSGEVGQALANAFLSEGNEAMIGTRNISKAEIVKWKKENPKGQAGSFSDAAKFGEIIILATKGSKILDAIKLTGLANFSNKVVIDATNPLADAPPDNGVLKFFTTLDESLMERIQKLIPEAKLVKAFNIVGSSFMYKPKFPGGIPTMFICGNDEKAKKKVTGILASFGWETEDMGLVQSARAIEPLAILWCIPGMLRNQWTHAFKLLKL
jgi:predicted dinucleotide-binding enzyme